MTKLSKSVWPFIIFLAGVAFNKGVEIAQTQVRMDERLKLMDQKMMEDRARWDALAEFNDKIVKLQKDQNVQKDLLRTYRHEQLWFWITAGEVELSESTAKQFQPPEPPRSVPPPTPVAPEPPTDPKAFRDQMMQQSKRNWPGEMKK